MGRPRSPGSGGPSCGVAVEVAVVHVAPKLHVLPRQPADGFPVPSKPVAYDGRRRDIAGCLLAAAHGQHGSAEQDKGANSVITVDFGTDGVKRLLLRVAPIEKL